MRLGQHFHLEALEDRLNPVSPADVFQAVAITQAHIATLNNTLANPGLFTIASNAPSTRAGATAIVAQAEAAANVLAQFMTELANQIQANPESAGILQVYLNETALLHHKAQTNQGTAQLIVNFIDITNDINAAAQRALVAAIANQQSATNGTTTPPTPSPPTNPFTTSSTLTNGSTTNTSGIPQNILDQLNAGGASFG